MHQSKQGTPRQARSLYASEDVHGCHALTEQGTNLSSVAPTLSMLIPRVAHFALFAFMLISTWSIATAQNLATAIVHTEQVHAELQAYAPQGVSPGAEVWVGLQLTHQPEWHTYWKNAGDSGLPTAFEWTLPQGVTAADIGWPTPRKIAIGSLINYGYEGKVLLPVSIQIGHDFKPNVLSSNLEIKLKAFWLVCRKECIPQEGEFLLRLPLQSSTALNADEFTKAFAAQPKSLSDPPVLEIAGQSLQLSVQGLPDAELGHKLELFPETSEIISPSAPWTQAWKGSIWTATVPLSPQRSETPSVMPWVLVGQSGSYRTQAAITGKWPMILDYQGQVAAPLNVSPVSTSTTDIGFFAAITGALIGGLILNLMPCVFPILAIKVVGFTQHADDQLARRVSGIAYSAGVVLSFLVLGALMMGLRAAGQELGWGFQLQSPAVTAGLAVLFTVIGLNLAGVFEFGQILPSQWATLQSKNPTFNAFLSGVLAVAVASPCTAPFMGASLGVAVAMPPLQALLVFAALGLGMALPYLAASLAPAIGRWLPRPGPWMDLFRRFMAFPMFATVIWLVWVLGQQTGIDGAAALLVILLIVTGTLWTINLPDRAAFIAGGIGLALLAAGLWQMGPHVMGPSTAAPTNNTQSEWQTWEPGKVNQLTSANQTVFVDFTAAWCVTCQYNKKTTLSNSEVLSDLKEKNVALLRADWTRRDPAISAALSNLGRSGVPVYVFYQLGKSPIILSEILSVEEIRRVIASL